MKMFVLSLATILASTQLSHASEPDCRYTGRGIAVDFQGVHIPEYSFELRGDRFPIGDGWYKFVETKIINNQEYVQDFTFTVRKGVYKNDSGEVISVCFESGRCTGKFDNTFFVGTFTGEYSPTQMKVVTKGKFLHSTDQRDIVIIETFNSDRECAW